MLCLIHHKIMKTVLTGTHHMISKDYVIGESTPFSEFHGLWCIKTTISRSLGTLEKMPPFREFYNSDGYQLLY